MLRAGLRRKELIFLFRYPPLAPSARDARRTLRMSPAMAADVTDRLWGVKDLVALWEEYEQKAA